jgi:hypothetical protein
MWKLYRAPQRSGVGETSLVSTHTSDIDAIAAYDTLCENLCSQDNGFAGVLLDPDGLPHRAA